MRTHAAPLPRKGDTAHQFSVHVYCGPGDIVRWGPSSFEKGHSPSIVGPCLLWPNGWMDQDTTWYEGRAQPMSHCVRRGPSSPPKGAHHSPSFRPMSIVATVAHLSHRWALVKCHVVTAESPFTVKTIDCVQLTGSRPIGREHAILQYVTPTLDVCRVPYCVGRCVKMGVVLHQAKSESRRTVLLGYLTISTNVRCC